MKFFWKKKKETSIVIGETFASQTRQEMVSTLVGFWTWNELDVLWKLLKNDSQLAAMLFVELIEIDINEGRKFIEFLVKGDVNDTSRI